MPTAKKLPKRSPMTRSARLKRYESVYNKIVRREGTGSSSKSKVRKSPKKIPRKKKIVTSSMETKSKGRHKESLVKNTKLSSSKDTSKQRSKRLTTYQKFVKTESRKTKYQSMIPKDRLVAIGAEWRSKNKKK